MQMRSNRERQKRKKKLTKGEIKTKTLQRYIFVQKAWEFLFPFFLQFSSRFGEDCILVSLGRKHLHPRHFYLTFSPPIKHSKYHFHHPKIIPTKWGLKVLLDVTCLYIGLKSLSM